MLNPAECSCGVAHKSRLGTAYNEEAFRHFLAVDRKRAGATRISFLLVLVRAKKQPGMIDGIPAAIAARIFAAMSLCLRDVDFTGWFRQDRVAGAVLAHAMQPPSALVAHLIGHRIMKTLGERVPSRIAGCLHVRVVQLRPTAKS
jgi:hypothetical protein